MIYKILVKHYYQDKHNPHIQTIIDNSEYYMRYALFKSLIDSSKDFEIQPINIISIFDKETNKIQLKKEATE